MSRQPSITRVLSFCLALSACLALCAVEADAKPSTRSPELSAANLVVTPPAKSTPVVSSVDACEIAKAAAAKAARDYLKAASRTGRCAKGHRGCSPSLQRSMEAAVRMTRARDAMVAVCK